MKSPEYVAEWNTMSLLYLATSQPAIWFNLDLAQIHALLQYYCPLPTLCGEALL